MKAEINLETKAAFFAQYLFQKLLGRDKSPYLDKINGFFINAVTHGTTTDDELWVRESFLLLTPLSQISDEEALHLGYTKENHKDSPWKGMSESEILLDCLDIIGGVEFSFSIEQVDYLRSRGFALPFRGLSVEEMIEAGWIKLKE